MAKYYITCINKEKIGTHTFISEAMIHEVANGSVHQGAIKTRTQILAILKIAGNEVRTAQWDYIHTAWDGGDLVWYETRNNVEYLRSHKNKVVNDNLLHLLPLGNLGH